MAGEALCLEYLRLLLLSEAHVFDAETSCNVTKQQLNRQGGGLGEGEGGCVWRLKGDSCSVRGNKIKLTLAAGGIFIQATETCKEVCVSVGWKNPHGKVCRRVS